MPATDIYWDTCVFTAYLNDEVAAYGNYVSHIGQYLEEAIAGKFRIHCSSITLAEITKGNLVSSKYASFSEFLEEYQSVVIQMSPDPIVMALAGDLRSLQYEKTGGRRKLLTPDAIHIASALVLKDVYKVPLSALQTFDDGKSKGPEGKSLPILSAETWCEKISSEPLAQRLITLPRCKPAHPTPKLPL